MLYIIAYLLIGFVAMSIFVVLDSKNKSPYEDFTAFDIVLYIQCLFLWPIFAVIGLLVYWFKLLRRL